MRKEKRPITHGIRHGWVMCKLEVQNFFVNSVAVWKFSAS